MQISAVIMAGGKGTRFWPKSTESFPKQFLKLFGDRTMLQHTVDRILPLMPVEHVYVVTNADYRDIVKEQLPDMPEENIIVEPIGRNTAPCIGLAGLHIEKKISDSVMIVLPSDHMILDVEGFQQTLKQAAELAYRDKALVTLGIKPDKPETGYGYIKFLAENKSGFNKVDRFVEKPDLQTAQSYLDSGDYLWNSGMFVWRTDVILDRIKEFLPQMAERLASISDSLGKEGYREVLNDQFPKMESISVDYGIMEKAENIYVFSSEFGWDDVGSWTAVERINERDEKGNVIKGNVINIDSKDCIIEGGPKLIATIGLKDLIIVEADDAILICAKEEAQRVKEVLDRLQK